MLRGCYCVGMAMRIDILTLFPEMFAGVLGASILRRASEAVLDKGSGVVREAVVSFHAHQLRDWSEDEKHRKVDGPAYGGGPGMVMGCEPVWSAVRSIEAMDAARARRVFLSPQGRPFTQRVAEELAQSPRLLLMCGHYEGLDERVLDALREDGGLDEVSVGDFVLSGGELAAMVVIDAVVRLLPGVLGHAESATNDSFSPGAGRLLDHPHYTKPAEWRGRAVPAVLMSGHHGQITAWRREQAQQRTRERRPDLLGADGGGANRQASVVTLRESDASEHAGLESVVASAFEDVAQREHAVAQWRALAGESEHVSGLAGLWSLSHGEQMGVRGLLGLGPVCVDGLWQGRGVGGALVREAIRQSQQAAAKRLFVVGEPAFFGPMGFEVAGPSFVTRCVGPGERGVLMVLNLRPTADVPGGTVVFPEAFGGR